MYPIYSEMLARTRSDDVSRTSEPRAERRSSLRIMLETRRARLRNPAR
jgi:hypothetical protein